jgi:hypothetical protein
LSEKRNHGPDSNKNSTLGYRILDREEGAYCHRKNCLYPRNRGAFRLKFGASKKRDVKNKQKSFLFSFAKFGNFVQYTQKIKTPKCAAQPYKNVKNFYSFSLI